MSTTMNAGPETINRFNMFPSATITGGPTPAFSEGQAADEVERIVQQSSPTSMGYDWSGVTQQQKAAGNLAPIVFGFAIILVFLFLSAQYESWATPFAVLLSVPLALLGAVVFTLVRKLDNDIYFQIGMILLVGLVTKNSILLVEYANQLKAKGMEAYQAMMESARIRFRPILMTSFATTMATTPIALGLGAGSASRRPLG